MVWLNLCDLGTFPWLLFWWLLPFLLGLLLGWILWGRLRAQLDECHSTLNRCQNDYNTLQTQYDECHSAHEQLISDNDGLRVKLSDLESKFAALKIAYANCTKSEKLGIATTLPTAKTSVYSSIPDDNLQIVEGVGPAMNRLLNENGIKKWSDLANQTPEKLRGMLDQHGGKYRIIDPSTWPMQASMANEGKWEELIAFQKSLSGSTISEQAHTDSKVEKILIKMGLLKKYKKDDLKAIEGIGPKIEGLLHDAGIKTWEALADTPIETLQDILTKAGSRFSLADPSTWPQQSRLAAQGKWKELNELQDFLQGGKEPGA